MFVIQILIFCFASVLSVNSQGSSNLACILPTYLNISSTLFKDCAAGTTNADNIQFWLATNAYPDYNRIYLGNASNMNFYDITLPTYFIIHGWTNFYNSPPLLYLKGQWLKNFNANIISVDWSCLATDYFKAATVNIQTVGFYIGEMILYLNNNYGLQLPDCIVFGHSMGAHIGGFTGKYVQANNGGNKLGYIAASDPAGPCITFPIENEPYFRLDPTDATYVQAFHCTGESTGTLLPLGSANIYFNKGIEVQCGCGLPSETDYVNICPPFCSHNNCLLYFIYSLTKTNVFKAKKITTFIAATSYLLFFNLITPFCPSNIPFFYSDKISTYMQVGIHGDRLNGNFVVPTVLEAPHCYSTDAGTCVYSAADTYSGGTDC